jgi:hypothetical protein
MRHHARLFLTAAACLLAGCNQPAVTLKAPAFQSSENTVRDWNGVAHRIVLEMSSRGLLPTAGQPWPLNTAPPRPIYIRVQAPDSAFIQHVADEMEGEITRIGGAVARAPSDATVVNLDVEWVNWGPRDKPPGLVGVTDAMLATSGIIIAASTPMSRWTAADAASAAAFGLGILADATIAMTPTTNAEAVWKATICTNDRVLMKLQETVYIRGTDIPLYAKATSRNLLSSWRSENVLLPRQIRYAQ